MYIKFYDTITSFIFKKNTIYQYIYLKISESKLIVLVLYVNNILFVNNDIDLLYKTKMFLIKNFKIVDINELAYVIMIKIFKDRSQGSL